MAGMYPWLKYFIPKKIMRNYPSLNNFLLTEDEFPAAVHEGYNRAKTREKTILNQFLQHPVRIISALAVCWTTLIR